MYTYFSKMYYLCLNPGWRPNILFNTSEKRNGKIGFTNCLYCCSPPTVCFKLYGALHSVAKWGRGQLAVTQVSPLQLQVTFSLLTVVWCSCRLQRVHILYLICSSSNISFELQPFHALLLFFILKVFEVASCLACFWLSIVHNYENSLFFF